jgi:tRNA(Ile)-lysidine synthase
MVKEFRRYIVDNNMFCRDSRILLAVSGGIDSMVMAGLFLAEGIDTGIAHCNFSLRGNESDLDEELVRMYARKNKLPFYTVKFDTKAFAKRNGLSVQMAARELRYKWLEEIRAQNGYYRTAVAHNLNDNIETLLINLIRGTGISGLTGIQPVSKSVIRPLLFATRSEIESYSKRHCIAYREDSSNADNKYTRNKIRHLVIPVLKDINPALEKTLAETIVKLKETDDLLDKYITGIRSSFSITEEGAVAFDADKLKSCLAEKTLLYELFKPYGLSGTQTEDLSNVIAGATGGQIFTSSHRILKNRRKIIVSPNEKFTRTIFRIKNTADLKNVPLIESARLVVLTENFVIPDDKTTACLDENEIGYPLIIRNWKRGDFFYPLGMKNKKKISDFLTDRKLSLIEKEKIMVLESGGKIAWVIGERIDSRFRIRSSTSSALILKAKV